MAGLTRKQKAFVDYYLELNNASEAARRAGYSEKSAGNIASENWEKPEVIAYLNQRSYMTDKEKIANVDEVLEHLTRTMRDEKALDRDRTRAAELLGKRYRIFTEGARGDDGVTIIFSGKEELED